MKNKSIVVQKGLKVSNLRWIVLMVCALLQILNYGDRAAIGVGAPSILNEFHFSKVEWGLIIGAFSFGYAPFCFVGGWTSDSIGPRKIFALAGAWWSVFTALTAAGYNFISFLILRIFFGFGEGPLGSVTTKAVGNWFPQREVGTAIGITLACTPLGGAICTPLVLWLMVVTHGSWRIPFIILGILGIIFSIAWFIVARDKPEIHPWITENELNFIQGGPLARRPEFSYDGKVPMLKEFLKKPLVWSTSFAFFGYAWVLFTFLSWFPIYLVEVLKINIKSLAISATIPWIAGTAGMALGGIVTDWIGRRTGKPATARKWMIVLALIGVGVCFAPSAFVTTVYSAVVLMSISVFLLYLTGAQYFAIIADFVPTSRLGGVMGFVHFIANLAGIVAAPVTGAIVQYTGSWSAGFGIGAVIILLGALGMAVFAKVDQKANDTQYVNTISH